MEGNEEQKVQLIDPTQEELDLYNADLKELNSKHNVFARAFAFIGEDGTINSKIIVSKIVPYNEDGGGHSNKESSGATN